MSRWSPTNSANQYICIRVRERRVEQNVGLMEMAGEIGISYQQLQKYEAGKNSLSAAKLWLIASYLEVPVAYFYPSQDSDELQS